MLILRSFLSLQANLRGLRFICWQAPSIVIGRKGSAPNHLSYRSHASCQYRILLLRTVDSSDAPFPMYLIFRCSSPEARPFEVIFNAPRPAIDRVAVWPLIYQVMIESCDIWKGTRRRVLWLRWNRSGDLKDLDTVLPPRRLLLSYHHSLISWYCHCYFFDTPRWNRYSLTAWLTDSKVAPQPCIEVVRPAAEQISPTVLERTSLLVACKMF